MSEKKPTRQAEIVFAAMKAIEANGGEMRISDIYETLASSFPLTDYEKEETKS
ncbi:Mrr restriction system protein, partial [Akkermansia muciniphila]